MAERQKGKQFAFGGQTSTSITHSDEAAAPTLTVIVGVIESVSPSITADKAEFRDGNGDVNGLIYTNQRTTLSVSFYASESSISISETKTNLAIDPGDSLTFADTTFVELNGFQFIIDEVTKDRNFGEVRKISCTMTRYAANDVSADAVA
jgi:hypothetical protein